jgi:hypothetical protein
MRENEIIQIGLPILIEVVVVTFLLAISAVIIVTREHQIEPVVYVRSL